MRCVAFIGLDGCGKSSIISKLKEKKILENCEFIWARWKPYFLKPMYKIVNGKNKTINKNEIDSGYKKNKKLKDKIFKSKIIKRIWLKLAYYDYKFIFNKKTKNKTKDYLFDRYYFDLFVDLGVNFNYSNEQILDLIKKYENKFFSLNKVFYIRVSPQVCFNRKNDIPNMEYLSRRYEIYEFLSNELDWDVIDGEDDFEVEMNLILQKLKEVKIYRE